MTERQNSGQASKADFEQIPKETMKAIAKEIPEEKAIKSNGEKPEAQEDARSLGGSWREVAQKVQHEHDPRRMNELAKQLVAMLDQEVKARRD